jgi:hypothetical protein
VARATALPVAALGWFGAALPAADPVGGGTADSLIAGTGAGAGGTAEGAVGALVLTGAERRRRGGTGGRGRRRWWRDRWASAGFAGIDLMWRETGEGSAATDSQQGFEDRAA